MPSTSCLAALGEELPFLQNGIGGERGKMAEGIGGEKGKRGDGEEGVGANGNMQGTTDRRKDARLRDVGCDSE